MSHQIKVLVCGDVLGDIEAFASKIATLNKKAGPFECVFCTGDFFGLDQKEYQKVTSGEVHFPVTTYILGPTIEGTAKYFAGQTELAPNLTYLGKKGLLTVASGMQIAYLSGVEGAKEDLVHFDGSTVDDLLASASAAPGGIKGVDLLLTSVWPADAGKFNVRKAPDIFEGLASAQISKLAVLLKPRYHFAAVAGKFFERQPYRNHQVLMETAEHATRFIALGKFGDKKEKHLYAFNIVPMKFLGRDGLMETSATTECPYGNAVKILMERDRIEQSKRDSQSGRQHQFFYDFAANPEDNEEESENGHHQRGHKRKGGRGGHHGGGGPKKPTGPCWFCLSSPEVEKHLVVSVGDCAYLALAKGGLTPDHLLILPIDHIQSLAVAPEELDQEIRKYQRALEAFFEASGRVVVFFERNFRSQHCQIQAVPVPKSCAGSLSETLLKLGDTAGLELAELPPETQIATLVNEGASYFWAELPPDGRHIFCRISPDKRFPLQFGREALASRGILNCPDRADWRKCEISKAQEEENARRFKEAFKEFDFTLVDDD